MDEFLAVQGIPNGRTEFRTNCTKGRFQMDYKSTIFVETGLA